MGATVRDNCAGLSGKVGFSRIVVWMLTRANMAMRGCGSRSMMGADVRIFASY